MVFIPNSFILDLSKVHDIFFRVYFQPYWSTMSLTIKITVPNKQIMIVTLFSLSINVQFPLCVRTIYCINLSFSPIGVTQAAVHMTTLKPSFIDMNLVIVQVALLQEKHVI